MMSTCLKRAMVIAFLGATVYGNLFSMKAEQGSLKLQEDSFRRPAQLIVDERESEIRFACQKLICVGALRAHVKELYHAQIYLAQQSLPSVFDVEILTTRFDVSLELADLGIAIKNVNEVIARIEHGKEFLSPSEKGWEKLDAAEQFLAQSRLTLSEIFQN